MSRTAVRENVVKTKRAKGSRVSHLLAAFPQSLYGPGFSAKARPKCVYVRMCVNDCSVKIVPIESSE